MENKDMTVKFKKNLCMCQIYTYKSNNSSNVFDKMFASVFFYPIQIKASS